MDTCIELTSDFNSLPSMIERRRDHVAVYHNGYVYAIGGFREEKSENQSEWWRSTGERLMIDGETEWEEIPSMTQ